MSERGVAVYSAANATVHALKSYLLPAEMWSALTQVEDVEAIFAALSKTIYGPYLAVQVDEMTPRRAAYQIRWRLADIFEKLIDLVDEPGRLLLIQIWHEFEVDNLKATLRGIESHASWDQVRHLLSPMRRFITITPAVMEKMVNAGDIAQAIETIRDTVYYDTLVHALARYEVEGNVFPLEVALDLDYYRALWQSIQRLEGLDHTYALRLVGTVIDVNNLLWAIRYRVYHHLSEQEIINYTLPFGYKVQDQQIRAIAAGADIASTVRQVYPDIGTMDQVIDQPGPELIQLERDLQRKIVKECRAVFLGNPFHVGIPIAFLYLNEFEVRNLTTLIEAKSSHMSAQACASMLVT